MLRLKKPLQHYVDKYGTPFYGLNKMYLLMEKQHNRGQDGAGLANIKLDVNPGKRYISGCGPSMHGRSRPVPQDHVAVQDLTAEELQDVVTLQNDHAFTGELFLGHLRYGTFGKNEIENCHPFLRQNNWRTRNLVVAGNFNLTNVDELFDVLVKLGQHPKQKSDTVTVLEKLGTSSTRKTSNGFEALKAEGVDNQSISERIADTLDLGQVLRRASTDFDGGYVMCGMVGHGDAFVVMRDPNGIRPAYWYEDDEVVVAASERPVIQTAFNVARRVHQEVTPGSALGHQARRTRRTWKKFGPPESAKPAASSAFTSRAATMRHLQRAESLGHGHCAPGARSGGTRPRPHGHQLHSQHGRIFVLWVGSRLGGAFERKQDCPNQRSRCRSGPRGNRGHSERAAAGGQNRHQGRQAAHLHHRRQLARRFGRPRLRHHLRDGGARGGQPRGHRRQHCAGHNT